ncbi:MAG TPA: GntR family transcriptional regulator [Vicinamibacterales bacterium]|jgi:GntR family transcriptional regulator
MVILNRDLPVPLYYQVKTSILREIEAGRWRPDDQLPTEDELADRFRVSKITVRQALRELAQLGYIRREQGRGTFVQRPPLVEGPRELTSFTEEMRRQGVATSSEVLEQGIVAASSDVASMLAIGEDDAVFRLKRLRLADGDPMGVQTAYIPAVLVPGVSDLSFGTESLYDVLRAHYNLYPSSAHETHFAFGVGAEDAGLLRLAVGSPVMGAERVARLADGRALEYVRSVMRADRYKIVLDLVKHSAARRDLS